MENTPKKIAAASAILMAFAFAARPCLADNPEAQKHFRLDFSVQETDGAKVVNSRNYFVIASSGSGATSIRAMNHVRVQGESVQVGVDIECGQITEAAEGLSLKVSADVSSLQPGETPASYPAIRQNHWQAVVAAPLRKPIVIFSSDDPTSAHRMRVELNATPLP